MRLRLFLLLGFIFPFLTGWGHWGPQVKIGLSLDHAQGREILVHKLKEELEENRADVLMADAKDDPATQESQVKDLLAKGIQALIVIPANPLKAAPLVEAAHAAGIKVLSLGGMIPGGLDYLVAFNAEKSGELQARALVAQVPKGRYALLGDSTDGSKGFRDGWMKVLQPLIDGGDIQIAASLAPDGAKAPKDLESFLKGKKVDALLTADNKKAGLSGKVPVAGDGEDLDTCRRIHTGTQWVTIYDPPQKLAEEAAYLAAKLARKAKQFDCQFTEINNGDFKTMAVLLTPLAVNAKNLDSTILKDGVVKKEDVYGK